MKKTKVEDKKINYKDVLSVIGKVFLSLCIILVGILIILLGFIFICSLLFSRTGLFFIGLLIIIICLLIFNIDLLVLLIKYMLHKDINIKLISIIGISSLFFIGCGAGVIVNSIPSFDYIENPNMSYAQNDFTFVMNDDLYIYYDKDIIVNYYEEDIDDVRVYLTSSDYLKYSYIRYGNGIYIEKEYINNMDLVKHQLDDINNKKIVNYYDNDNYVVNVYASSENIQILKDNLSQKIESCS